jgi:outer membrane protein insertion porin family
MSRRPARHASSLLALASVLFAAVLAPPARAQGEGAAKPATELSLPTTLPDPAALEGKRVASVRVKIEGSLWQTPPTVLVPALDEPFSLVVAQGQLRRLLGAGGFASGSLELAPAKDDGVDVLYRLTPSRFLRRLTVNGGPLPDEDVRRASGLADAREITEASMLAAADAVTSYYARRGYPKTHVEASAIETTAPLVVNIELQVEVGAAKTVSGRTFVGLPTWDPQASAAATAYAVHPSEVADEDSLEAADRALGAELRAIGYPQASVSHSSVADDRGAGKVGLLVKIDAGSKILPRFEGAAVFDQRRLLEILGLRDEADRSPLHLAAKIEDAYVRRGYLDARVNAELLGVAGDRQRTLLFRVHEGELVKVSGRVYPCLRGALGASRLDEEIDSFLDEELGASGIGEVAASTDAALGSGTGDVGRGARIAPAALEPNAVFVGAIYDRAVEHLRELLRSEGYVFADVGNATLVRATCKAGTQPDVCIPVPPPAMPDVCRSDIDGLPRESLPLPKSLSCVPDPSGANRCAPTASVYIPVNPGPRSTLWDVQVDGTKALAPAVVLGAQGAGQDLRMGQPLSLKDVETARQHVIELYKDEGYAFASVRASVEYSPDRTRARIRYTVNEGEQVIVDHIEVEGARLTSEQLIRDRLRFAPGEVYRQRKVKESQERLTRLGVFTSASIAMANPGIPAKRKTVIVSVVEKKAAALEAAPGFSTGQGIKLYAEIANTNAFGQALTFAARGQIAIQPLFVFGPGPLTSGYLASDVVSNWQSKLTDPITRVARRLTLSATAPHVPLLGADWIGSLEFSNVNDLWSQYRLERTNLPSFSLTYQPARWFSLSFGTGFELNSFQIFQGDILTLLSDPKNNNLASTLFIPAGNSGVYALRATISLEGRDNPLSATRGGHLAFTTEYVKGLYENGPTTTNPTNQNFLHLLASADWHVPLNKAARPWVLAFQLRGGVNINVLECASNPQRSVTIGMNTTQVDVCASYPDRLFYLGGIDSIRGFYPATLTPQDTIDKIAGKVFTDTTDASGNVTTAAQNQANAVQSASRGGNVFINPRIELRIPAFSFGSIVLFADAANSWFDLSAFQPWKLRFSFGPGISIDTPVGPIVLDVGFNPAPNTLFGEQSFAVAFSIGRF